MKNWNDAGTVHYNAATNQHYVERRIAFEYRGAQREFFFAIPREMLRLTKLEHFDQAIIKGKEVIDQTALQMMKGGDFRADHIEQCSNRLAFVAMCECLYNQFHLEQHKLGNAVWAVPERLQEVGPKPEDDFVM